MSKKQLDELQDLPDELKLKLAKYMYVHEPEQFDKRVNGSKPKKQPKYSVPLTPSCHPIFFNSLGQNNLEKYPLLSFL